MVLVVAIALVGFNCFDALKNGFDATKCACILLGIAVGVLVTNVLSQVIEDDTTRTETKRSSTSGNVVASAVPATNANDTKRVRKVSFGRSTVHHHPSHRHTRERSRSRSRERHHHSRHTHHRNTSSGYDPALRDVISPTPTLTYSVDTAPSISMTSVTSSIDPKGQMSPTEREVAILRARASLADSERRRFKEERKWALSMGNKARANQLAWQVKRYAALMESYHREADAKVVEG